MQIYIKMYSPDFNVPQYIFTQRDSKGHFVRVVFFLFERLSKLLIFVICFGPKT